MHQNSAIGQTGTAEAAGQARLEGRWSGGRRLKGIEHVAGEQSKDGHHQDRFQLLVVRGSTAKVIACRLLGVVLNRDPLAYRVRRDVLHSLMAKFALIHLSSVPCL